jgi:hypothetical protein
MMTSKLLHDSMLLLCVTDDHTRGLSALAVRRLALCEPTCVATVLLKCLLNSSVVVMAVRTR